MVALPKTVNNLQEAEQALSAKAHQLLDLGFEIKPFFTERQAYFIAISPITRIRIEYGYINGDFYGRDSKMLLDCAIRDYNDPRLKKRADSHKLAKWLNKNNLALSKQNEDTFRKETQDE